MSSMPSVSRKREFITEPAMKGVCPRYESPSASARRKSSMHNNFLFRRSSASTGSSPAVPLANSPRSTRRSSLASFFLNSPVRTYPGPLLATFPSKFASASLMYVSVAMLR